MPRRTVAKPVRQTGPRWRGAASTAEHEVRAVVEARLLGIRLLSIKAHVVTGPPSSRGALSALTTLPVDAPDGPLADRQMNGRGGTLSDAMAMLAESTSTLKRL